MHGCSLYGCNKRPSCGVLYLCGYFGHDMWQKMHCMIHN
uniref:Uncharacterized protein n=1 Tax=Arundo donax TaxID=35708 RepID=A0A0A8ZLC2_ARUDO